MFDGGYGFAVHRNSKVKASRNGGAVDNDGAAAAQTLSAAFARAEKSELVQQFDQIAVRFDACPNGAIVECEADFARAHSSSPMGRPSATRMARSRSSARIGRSIKRTPTAS